MNIINIYRFKYLNSINNFKIRTSSHKNQILETDIESSCNLTLFINTH